MNTHKIKLRLWAALLVILLSLVFGVIGFHIIEDRSWLDSLYVVVQIFSTVGLDKQADLSPAGRALVIVLITVFLTGFTAAATMVVQDVVGGHLRLKQRWREKKANKMKGHYIVCGYGRLGRQTVTELAGSKNEVVVIESSEEVARELEDRGIPVVVQDATDEDALRRAGVEKAAGLITSLPDDADNVFVTLTARQMNPTIRIISRANSEKTSSKLYQAGVEQVVLPQEMGGKQMAYALVRPIVADFINYVTGASPDLQLGQWTVPKGSPVIGKTVREAQFRNKYGVTVLGMARGGRQVEILGWLDQVLDAGDTLVLLGADENLKSMPF
ncbi:MAG: potassium channel protein [Lentisphaeria bacterium]